MRIGISGSTGMIGWHMRCYLKQFSEHSVFLADRSTFSDERKLRDFVNNCDVIIHLAGQNRGSTGEIRETNVGLARDLVAACAAMQVCPQIIHSSSIHAESDSSYGRSKREAGAVLREWSNAAGAKFVNLILPHVFGEGTKPFYNSAVATFAHQLAIGEVPQVINDGQLELVHAQDLSAKILQLVLSGHNGDIRIPGRSISVNDVLDKLRQLSESYSTHVIPDLRNPLDLQLFNLHRSYLFPANYPRKLQQKSDERGALVEAVKNLNGGQAFVSTTIPGVTRGDHFHYRKVERFLVLKGKATIRVRRLFDNVVHTFEVNGADPAYIDMPTLHTHNIVNTGDTDLLTLFWTNEIFDPEDPDTIFEPV